MRQYYLQNAVAEAVGDKKNLKVWFGPWRALLFGVGDDAHTMTNIQNSMC